MRIGPFHVLRVRKNPLGRPIHHWEEITLDQLSPDAQQLIAKMARASLRDHFEEERESWQEARTTEIGARVAEQLAPVLAALQDPAPATPAHPLVGDCMLCGRPMTAGVKIIDAGSSWAHAEAKDCSRPSALLDSVPDQKTAPVPVAEGECTGPHYCRTAGTPAVYCRESCTACMYPAQPRPCFANHRPEEAQ